MTLGKQNNMADRANLSFAGKQFVNFVNSLNDCEFDLLQ